MCLQRPHYLCSLLLINSLPLCLEVLFQPMLELPQHMCVCRWCVCLCVYVCMYLWFVCVCAACLCVHVCVCTCVYFWFVCVVCLFMCFYVHMRVCGVSMCVWWCVSAGCVCVCVCGVRLCACACCVYSALFTLSNLCRSVYPTPRCRH